MAQARAGAVRPYYRTRSTVIDNWKRTARPINQDESKEYAIKQKHQPHGLAVIFNLSHCTPPNPVLGDLPGYLKDEKGMQELFEEWHFCVEIYRNVTAAEAKQVLRQTRGAVSSSHDALIMAVLCHGGERGVLAMRDFTCRFDTSQEPPIVIPTGGYITVDEMYQSFNNAACPQLLHKPRVFIFQACRGLGVDQGVYEGGRCRVASAGAHGQQRHLDMGVRYPTDMDYIAIFACTSGLVSYVPEAGSFLVQTMLRMFKRYYGSMHLEDMMLEVKKRIKEFDYPPTGMTCPETRSLLTKRLYFKPPQ